MTLWMLFLLSYRLMLAILKVACDFNSPFILVALKKCMFIS